MKLYIANAIAVYMLCFFAGCEKDPFGTPAQVFYKQAAGKWVPYESVDGDGTIHTGPFLFNSIFGSYAESVQFNSNHTFIAGNYQNDVFKPEPFKSGNYEYSPGNVLQFDGDLKLMYELLKFEENDLWVKFGDGILKLKRIP
jgi:hypothetical protein